MSRVDDLRDMQVLQALSGVEDLTSLGIQIIDNYLERELMENLREAGYRVPKKYLPLVRSQEEKDDWKRQKWLEVCMWTHGSGTRQAWYLLFKGMRMVSFLYAYL